MSSRRNAKNAEKKNGKKDRNEHRENKIKKLLFIFVVTSLRHFFNLSKLLLCGLCDFAAISYDT